mmetsp:Transcript_3358/g.2809  ORF Transcript_3358/g.2809 Transcript_3358/m.2809 type:complete len:83 (-) Transcript_3358:22-270(-)
MEITIAISLIVMELNKDSIINSSVNYSAIDLVNKLGPSNEDCTASYNFGKKKKKARHYLYSSTARNPSKKTGSKSRKGSLAK